MPTVSGSPVRCSHCDAPVNPFTSVDLRSRSWRHSRDHSRDHGRDHGRDHYQDHGRDHGRDSPRSRSWPCVQPWPFAHIPHTATTFLIRQVRTLLVRVAVDAADGLARRAAAAAAPRASYRRVRSRRGHRYISSRGNRRPQMVTTFLIWQVRAPPLCSLSIALCRSPSRRHSSRRSSAPSTRSRRYVGDIHRDKSPRPEALPPVRDLGDSSRLLLAEIRISAIYLGAGDAGRTDHLWRRRRDVRARRILEERAEHLAVGHT